MRMRSDHLVRYGGLALVLLFPLVSLLQLRDTERPWQEAARRARPAVIGLYRSAAAGDELVACGVVAQSSPPRVVVPGRIGGALRSRNGSGWVEWRLLCTDLQGEFSILEAARASGSLEAAAALPAAARLRADPGGALSQDVEAALVPPEELANQPLWVGVLRARPSVSGRPSYFSSYLEPITSVSLSGDALAAAPESIDPMLRGAPFVDQNGTVIALYLDAGAAGIRALPIEVVLQTLAVMQLQAAK
jgi:hypothetical protein